MFIYLLNFKFIILELVNYKYLNIIIIWAVVKEVKKCSYGII